MEVNKLVQKWSYFLILRKITVSTRAIVRHSSDKKIWIQYSIYRPTGPLDFFRATTLPSRRYCFTWLFRFHAIGQFIKSKRTLIYKNFPSIYSFNLSFNFNLNLNFSFNVDVYLKNFCGAWIHGSEHLKTWSPLTFPNRKETASFPYYVC